MTRIPDTHADLLSGPVALATVDVRGYPQLTAIVVKVDADGRCHASVNTTRRKYKNMMTEPRATVFAIDPSNGQRTIEIRADIELLPDPDKSWTREFVGPSVDLDARSIPLELRACTSC